MLTAYNDILSLRWFRDQGRGQEAADAVKADQVLDGPWPVAVLTCKDYKDSEEKWWDLLRRFGVNSMTYHPVTRLHDPVRVVEES
jgi:hypothetical protein